MRYNQKTTFGVCITASPQPSPRVASTVSANPAPPSLAEGTSKQNNDTWVVAHGTNLRIRSRLVAGAGVAGRARLRSAWQQRCGGARLNQLG